MGDFWCHSLEINFSPVMSFPGGPGIVNGQILPQMQCSMMITAFLMFGAVMYKTIFVINIIIHMCLQHSNT